MSAVATPARRSLVVLLAEPRGFCAGVERAIVALDDALTIYGAPIYVRHHIVHNPTVIRDFEARGAVFVEDLQSVPRNSRVLFSAHGVSPAIIAQAKALGLRSLDTTCPLVTKVHREVTHHIAHDRSVIVVGHRHHVEVLGIIGNAPENRVAVVETAEDARTLPLNVRREYAYVTQTTLSREDVTPIVAALKARIPRLIDPPHEDICFATTNRQAAVKVLAAKSDAVVVLGGRASSNSQRLLETAIRAGCKQAYLLESPDELDVEELKGCNTIGVASGASTPEKLVDELKRRLSASYDTRFEVLAVGREDVHFRKTSLAGLL